ncbi:caspase family protein [Luteimonas viscosa]|nr:caspase family protein [Luteimonas viscosa]
MGRAIVLIGVSRTANPGQFPDLPGVRDAIRRMREWAQGQQFEAIEEVTEETVGRVTAIAINDTIDEIIRSDQNLEQLVIYFSGHGIINATNEYWLLSLAPSNSNEAVNVSGSLLLAEAGHIPHVVFISDACRTPASTTQLGRITGSLITPNRPNPDTQQYVDVFYATRLGAPAIEIAAEAASYVAVYTLALEMALGGGVPQLIEQGYVRPRPLGDWLKTNVPRLLARMKPRSLLSQGPEARICSPPEAWVAQFTGSAATGRKFEAAEYLAAISYELELAESSMAAVTPRRTPGKPASVAAFELMRSLTGLRAHELNAWDPKDSGVVVIGDLLHSVTCAARDVQLTMTQSDSVFAARGTRQGQLLVEFADGSGVLVPLINGYTGVVRIEGGCLREVHYEPASRSMVRASREELQLPRSILYRAVASGELNLDEEATLTVSRLLTSSTFFDPALSACAVYAYQGASKLTHIRKLQRHLLDRGAGIFDLAMMARDLLKADESPNMSLSLPMLSQGWAYLDALVPRFPGALRRLQEHTRDSLWCHYERQGVSAIRCWLDREGYHTHMPSEGA